MALVAAWLMDEGSGSTAAEYGGTTALDFLLTNVSLGAGGIDFGAGSSDYAAISSANNSAIQVSAPFSLAMRITMDGTTTTQQSFFHATSDNSNYSGYNLITDSSGNLEFMYGDNTGIFSGNRRSWTGPALSASTQYDILVVCTDTSGATTGVTIYVNGSSQSLTASGTGGAMVYTADPTEIGRWLTRSRGADHVQRYAALWNHELSSSDASSLVSDYESFITGGGGGSSSSGPLAGPLKGPLGGFI